MSSALSRPCVRSIQNLDTLLGLVVVIIFLKRWGPDKVIAAYDLSTTSPPTNEGGMEDDSQQLHTKVNK